MSVQAAAPELRVLPSADAVAEAAATEIAQRLAGAIAARGVAHWVVTGGSSAPGIYHHLSRMPLRELVDWSRVHAWWGDDRFVPPDHPLSNVLPFTQVLLTSGGDEEGGSPESADVGGHGDGVRIPASQIHQVPMTEAIAHAGGAAWAATGYMNAIKDHGPAVERPDGLPAFDVFVAGVGPDGHILSVFPGSTAWDAETLCVGVPAPTHIEPHVDRVTMHPRLVAAARRVVVVAAGGSKAAVLGRAWTGDDARELPVRATRLGHATWILDEAAAAELPRP
jgi:6-phosphogluconolactonase